MGERLLWMEVRLLLLLLLDIVVQLLLLLLLLLLLVLLLLLLGIDWAVGWLLWLRLGAQVWRCCRLELLLCCGGCSCCRCCG